MPIGKRHPSARDRVIRVRTRARQPFRNRRGEQGGDGGERISLDPGEGKPSPLAGFAASQAPRLTGGTYGEGKPPPLAGFAASPAPRLTGGTYG